MPSSTPRLRDAAAAGLRLRRRRGVHPDLRHDPPRADRSRPAQEPARRCSSSALPAASAPRRSRSARSSARASSLPHRATRSADFCRSIGADATINYAQPQHPRRAEAAHRRQGSRRRLRPGRRRSRRAGVPLDRLARPLPRRRLRAGTIPSLPLNLALLEGRVDRRRVLGRVRAPRAEGQRRRLLAELARWYAEGKVKPVIDQRLPMRELPAAYARMGSRTGARQAGHDQRADPSARTSRGISARPGRTSARRKRRATDAQP